MTMLTVTLGGFVFADFEVPERLIAGGGRQRLVVHELVGDGRDIQVMGLSARPIAWSGRFRGGQAISRAQELDAIFKAGAPVALTYGEFSYTVVIEVYEPDLEGNQFEVPYTISCVVKATEAASTSDAPSIDQMVNADHLSIQSLGAKITGAIAAVQAKVQSVVGVFDRVASAVRSFEAGPVNFLFGTLDPLSSALFNLASAVGAVPSFALADRSTLASVIGPLMSVQQIASAGISACEDVMGVTPDVGAEAPGVRPLVMAAVLDTQVTVATQVADLYDLHNLTARMATNLAAIGSGGAVVTVAGANLFELAARYYGDATEWTTIAKANGLTEPVLTGLRSLLIPPTASGSGGVLKEIIGSDTTEVTALVFAPDESGFGQLDFSNPDNSVLLGV